MLASYNDDAILYIKYLQFLNNLIIIKAKVLLLRALVTLAYGSPPSGIGDISRFWIFCLGLLVLLLPYFTQSNQMYSLINYKRFVKQTIVIDDFLLHDAILPCKTD